MGTYLANWPYQSQLNWVSDDGYPPSNMPDNCGETCVSMSLQWGLGLHVLPDDIKDAIFQSETATGYSYVSQLSDYLNTRGVSTHYEQTDLTSAIQMSDAWLAAGNPTIFLLYADRVNQKGGHFVTKVGKNDDGGPRMANPWIGGPEDLSPAALQQAYNGWVLHVALTAFQPMPVAPPPPTHASGAKFLVLRDMMFRKNDVQDPTPNNIYMLPNGQPQIVHAGAVLNGTGQQSAHWVQVTAGSNVGWLWLANCKAV